MWHHISSHESRLRRLLHPLFPYLEMPDGRIAIFLQTRIVRCIDSLTDTQQSLTQEFLLLLSRNVSPADSFISCKV